MCSTGLELHLLRYSHVDLFVPDDCHLSGSKKSVRSKQKPEVLARVPSEGQTDLESKLRGRSRVFFEVKQA